MSICFLHIFIAGTEPRTYVERGVECSNDGKAVEQQTERTANDATGGLVWQLVQAVTLVLPSHSEANVGQANGTPDEERRQTRKRQQPVKDGTLVTGNTNVGKNTKSQLENDTPDGTALLVDVRKRSGPHAALSHSLEGTGGTVCARVGDTND